MMPSDWERILHLLEASGEMNLSVPRSLLLFLRDSSVQFLGEQHLLAWMRRRLDDKIPLLNVLVGLSHLNRVVLIASQEGLAGPDLIQRLRGRVDLLDLLPGGRPKVPLRWQPILADFEKSLRGYTPLHAARTLEVAKQLIDVSGDRDYPDDTAFVCWLDRDVGVSQASLSFPLVERFCQFLVDHHASPTNPAREWRLRCRHLAEALHCRKKGLPIPPRPESAEESCLTSHIQDFQRFKQALGRKYACCLNLHLLGRYALDRGVRQVEEIDLPFLQDFLSERKWALATRVVFQGLLQGFFHFLVRRGVLSAQKNPARALPRLRRRPRLPYIYSVHEVGLILAEFKRARTSPFNRLAYSTVILLLYACGLRRSEARKLLVDDVDLKQGILFIRCTKFGKDRRIPVGPRTCARLQDYHRERSERLGPPMPAAPFFVEGTGKNVNSQTLGWHHRAACKRANVGLRGPKPRLHDFRHSFAVHRLNKWYLDGDDPQSRLAILSIYMGHVSSDSTQCYLHLSQDLLRIAGRALERSVESLLSVDPSPLSKIQFEPQ